MIKAVIYTLSAFGTAFIIANTRVVVEYYYSLHFEAQPTKQQLELAEVVFRSREVVTSYWNKYQQCPTVADLYSIEQISVVDTVIVIPILDKSQCVVSVQLTKDQFNNKEIKQVIEFSKVDKPLLNKSCYHNMRKELMWSSCQNYRDIDSLAKVN